MAANTDKFLYTGDPGTATNLAGSGYTVGDTSITVDTTSGFPTGSGVVFGIDTIETDSNGEEVRVDGSYCVFIGVVTGGSTIGSLVKLFGDSQNYPAGATTRVYITISSLHNQRLMDGILTHANQDGTLKATAVQTAIGTGGITGANLANASVTNAKLATTSGELGGAWQTWTPTWTNFTLGNSVVDAKYIQIGKVVHFRLSLIIGSTSTFGVSPKFSLPVTSAAYAFDSIIGNTTLVDTGTGVVQGFVDWQSTTTAMPVAIATTYFGGLSSSAPFNWASNDKILCTATYEAA